MSYGYRRKQCRICCRKNIAENLSLVCIFFLIVIHVAAIKVVVLHCILLALNHLLHLYEVIELFGYLVTYSGSAIFFSFGSCVGAIVLLLVVVPGLLLVYCHCDMM